MEKRTTISTLGPEGTDSMRAGRYLLTVKSHGRGLVIGRESFRAALDDVVDSRANAAIMPLAYKPVQGELGFFDLLAKYDGSIHVAESFNLRTKPMVFATRPRRDLASVRTVASHPSTAGLVPQGYSIVEINSKPSCVEAVLNGQAYACIGSLDVAVERGLEIVREYKGNPMTWLVFKRIPKQYEEVEFR